MPRRTPSAKVHKRRSPITQATPPGLLADNASGPEVAEKGELPGDWRSARLGEVGIVRYGLGQPPEEDPEGLPIIRATNVKRGVISPEGLLKVKASSVPVGRNPFLKSGDIIVVRSGAYTGDVAMVTQEWDGAIAGYDLIFSSSDNVDPSFCAFQLLTNRVQAYFRGQRDRSAQPHLNRHQLETTEVLVPPLPEQRAIAEVLRKVQRTKEATEKVIASTRQLKASLMKHLFTYGPVPFNQADRVALRETDWGVFPVHWTPVPLGEIASARGGIGFPPAHQGCSQGRYPFLKVSDMNLPGNEAEIQRANNYVNEEVRAELGSRVFPPGTVIFPKVGAALHTNKKRFLKTEALLDNNLMGVTVSSPARCESAFLFRWFETVNLSELSNPGPLPSINAARVKSRPIALPPLDEQRLIAAQLSAVDAKLAVEDKRRAALDALFKSLLQHLMTGKVRLAEPERGGT